MIDLTLNGFITSLYPREFTFLGNKSERLKKIQVVGIVVFVVGKYVSYGYTLNQKGAIDYLSPHMFDLFNVN